MALNFVRYFIVVQLSCGLVEATNWRFDITLSPSRLRGASPSMLLQSLARPSAEVLRLSVRNCVDMSSACKVITCNSDKSSCEPSVAGPRLRSSDDYILLKYAVPTDNDVPSESMHNATATPGYSKASEDVTVKLPTSASMSGIAEPADVRTKSSEPPSVASDFTSTRTSTATDIFASSSLSSSSSSSPSFSREISKTEQTEAFSTTSAVPLTDSPTSSFHEFSKSATAEHAVQTVSDNNTEIVSALATSEKPPTNALTWDVSLASSKRYEWTLSTVNETSNAPGRIYREEQTSIGFSRVDAVSAATDTTTGVSDTDVSYETSRFAVGDTSVSALKSVTYTTSSSVIVINGSRDVAPTSSSAGGTDSSSIARYSTTEESDSATTDGYTTSRVTDSNATAHYSATPDATGTSYSSLNTLVNRTYSSAPTSAPSSASSSAPWSEVIVDCRASRKVSTAAGNSVLELGSVAQPVSGVKSMAVIGNDLWVVGNDQQLYVLSNNTDANATLCSIAGRTWSAVAGITNVKNVTRWLDDIFVYTTNDSLYGKPLPFQNNTKWEKRTPKHPVNLRNWTSYDGSSYYGVPFDKQKLSIVKGNSPTECGGNVLATDYKSITVSREGLWIVNGDGLVLMNDNSPASGCSGLWTKLNYYTNVTTVSAAADELLLLTSNGTCHVLQGVRVQARSANSTLIASRLLSYAVMSPSNIIWGLDANGTLFSSQLL